MKIQTKFDLNQKVFISSLNEKGKVLSIFIGGSGRIEYNCRYFDGKSPKECFFLEEELSSSEEKQKIGFQK